MVRFGVDYSFSRPDIQEMKAAGVTFAIRYVSTAGNRKNMTAGETKALIDAGIDVVTNYETSVGFMLAGYTAGVAAARSGLAQAKAAGMPDGRPIYFSLDVDPSTVNIEAVLRFCDGAATILGRQNVGIYGGYKAIKAALDSGRAPWAWQTYAWSGGRWDSRAQLQQYKNGQAMGGGTVDYCRAMTPDFGQWGVTWPRKVEDMPFTEDDKSFLKEEVFSAVVHYLDHGADTDGSKHHHAQIRADIAAIRTDVAALKAAVGTLSDDEANILAAIQAVSTGSADVQEIVSQLRTALPGDVVAGIKEAL